MSLQNYRGNSKGLIFIVLFRTSNFFTRSLLGKVIGFPVRLFYKLFVNWFLGIDIPDTTCIGRNLVIWHGIGLVVHPKCIIGDNVTLRHNTTIGNASLHGGVPVIGNGCNIGANSVILGDIRIGDNSIVGAGSVITKSIPANVTVVGNPARILS